MVWSLSRGGGKPFNRRGLSHFSSVGKTSAREANRSYLCASRHVSKHLPTGNRQKVYRASVHALSGRSGQQNRQRPRREGYLHRRAIPQISLQFRASPKRHSLNYKWCQRVMAAKCRNVRHQSQSPHQPKPNNYCHTPAHQVEACHNDTIDGGACHNVTMLRAGGGAARKLWRRSRPGIC